MRTRTMKWLPALVAVVLVVPAIAADQDTQLPVVDGQPVLATVNGEPVTAEDLVWQIGAMHKGMAQSAGMLQKPDTTGVMERVINAKLIVQEARQIGLDETPELASTMKMGRDELIKQFMVEDRLKDITAGAPKIVEQLYRDAVLELKIHSALFQTIEDASAFKDAIQGETSFDQALESYTESDKAVLQEGPFLKLREMRPEVAGTLRNLEPGDLMDPMQVQGGIAVIQLLEERLPDDPAARADAEEAALTIRQQEELQTYTQELRDTYVKVDEELLEGLDFDSAERDLEAYRGDERVVAEVKGAESVTVKELTARVEQLLFHGLDQAADRNRINAKLAGVLDRIVLERAMELEAKRLGIEDNPEFRKALTGQQDSMLFGTFVRRVVNPEIKISDEAIASYYTEHIDEYMTSAMIRIKGLSFGDREHAEASLEKLRQGSDLNWMSTHADGLIDVSSEVDGVMKFGGQVLAVQMLPAGVQAAVEGAVSGDFRLYSQEDGPVYVLAVQEVYPAQPQDFATVRDQILQRLFLIEREATIEQWMEDLRQASQIEIHASAEQIREIVGLGPSEDQ